MSPYLCEYVVHEFATPNERLVFLGHQYFVQQVDLASNVPVLDAQLRNQHAVHQIPLEHQNVAQCLPRYQRPTPLVLSTM